MKYIGNIFINNTENGINCIVCLHITIISII